MSENFFETPTMLVAPAVTFEQAIGCVRRYIMRENDYNENEVDRIIKSMNVARRQDDDGSTHHSSQLAVTIEFCNFWGQHTHTMKYGVDEPGVMWEMKKIKERWVNVTRYFRGEE